MPIHFLILQSEPETKRIDVDSMTMSGVAVSVISPMQLPNITHTPDVVLLADAPNRDTLSQIKKLQTTFPASKLIVRGSQSCHQAITFLQAGVIGVLDSDHETKQLAEIVKQVYGNQCYLDSRIAQLLAIRHIKKLLEPFTALSSREFDVLCLLAEGAGLQSISNQLKVSSKTVSNCQSQIKAKLGLESREALVDFAQKHGLIA